MKHLFVSYSKIEFRKRGTNIKDLRKRVLRELKNHERHIHFARGVTLTFSILRVSEVPGFVMYILVLQGIQLLEVLEVPKVLEVLPLTALPVNS